MTTNRSERWFSMVRRKAWNTAVLGLLVCGLCNIRAEAPSGHTDSNTEALVMRHVFHIAGIPGVKRNGRGDLVLSTRTLTFFKDDRAALVIPYTRIQHVRVAPADREYAKATYAAVLAAGAPGALLLLKKRHVDALAIDFENERGGRMSAVIQVSKGDGARCSEWLAHYGIKVEGPIPPPWLQTNK
jgi:hypothetical protein